MPTAKRKQRTSSGRDARGRFEVGNVGGPGRPARPVEIQYLAALVDVVTLDEWATICQRAVKDARAGSAAARDWLTKYLMGGGLTLTDVAIRDYLKVTPADELAEQAREAIAPWTATGALSGGGPLGEAWRVKDRAAALAEGVDLDALGDDDDDDLDADQAD